MSVEPRPPTDPAPPDEAAPGSLARSIAWARDRGAAATAWALDARGRHASVDVGLRAADRDKQVAAGVLAGGVAYRLFFWTLALAVLLSGGLGFVGDSRIEESAEDLGLGSTVAHVITGATRESDAGRWWLLLIGAWLVLWTGYMGTKALVLVNAAVWGVPPLRIGNAFKASLAFTGGALAFMAVLVLARWLRDEAELFGLVFTLALVVIPFGAWLAVSTLLPHRAGSLVELMPGAALLAVGVQALHLFTALFLGPKLTNATELYGGIGIATTILFWLYIVGRLVIAAAIVNASFVDSRRGAGEDRGP
jgi:uncharacterized BrkB/YihY/UPF0761 family membrane protein